jgi:hypothetical protein
MQKTKDGKRMWYSLIGRERDIASVEDDVKEKPEERCRSERSERARKERMQRRQEEYVGGLRWAWGRKSWQPGLPEALPTWLIWEKKQWKEWIERMATQPNTGGAGL